MSCALFVSHVITHTYNARTRHSHVITQTVVDAADKVGNVVTDVASRVEAAKTEIITRNDDDDDEDQDDDDDAASVFELCALRNQVRE